MHVDCGSIRYRPFVVVGEPAIVDCGKQREWTMATEEGVSANLML